MMEEGESMKSFFKCLQLMLINEMGLDSLASVLLSTPFHIYEDTVDYFLALFRARGEAEPDDEVKNILILYRIINKIGELFEEQLELRAAIWCYNHNLKSLKDQNVRFPRTAPRKSLVSQLCYIGLANKRMDNFTEASRCYEAAINELSAHSSAFGRPGVKESLMKNLIGNAKQLQLEANEWFGTSGEMTGWSLENNDDVVEMACATCSGKGVKKCSACRLVCYCNTECQSSHWTNVHKYTCLGKTRRK